MLICLDQQAEEEGSVAEKRLMFWSDETDSLSDHSIKDIVFAK